MLGIPANAAFLQGFVIGLLVFLNQFLKADIFTHNIAMLIKQHKREQSAHTPIAVIERVNAQKIENKKHQ